MSGMMRCVTLRVLLLLAVLVPATAHAQTETVEYYALDAIGSVRVVFDASGAVVARSDYTPFGAELSSSPKAPDRKFAGLFRDGEAGLDYAQARSYQVRTGRFSAPDPVYAAAKEPQRWNRYSYSLNSPLGYVDHTGLNPDSGIPGFCSADNSFGRCGGSDAFWNLGGGGGGPAFGDGHAFALDLGYFPGMPAEMWSGLLDFHARAETAFARARLEWAFEAAEAQRAAEQTTGSVSTSTSNFQAVDGDNRVKLDGGSTDPFVQMAQDISNRAGALTNPLTYGEWYLLSAAGGLAGRAVAAAASGNLQFDGPSPDNSSDRVIR